MDSLMKDTHYKKEEDDGDEGDRFTQESRACREMEVGLSRW